MDQNKIMNLNYFQETVITSDLKMGKIYFFIYMILPLFGIHNIIKEKFKNIQNKKQLKYYK